MRIFFIIIMMLFAVTMQVTSQVTELQYLSGKGYGNTVKWDFFCSAGRNSGKWKKIEVPSQWELQGFGEYTYGRFYLVKGAKPSNEIGTYRYKFDVPLLWKDRNVSICFDGVMTDAEVFINKKKAGLIHQGGFCSFEYDVTDKLLYGNKNMIEVRVSKESTDQSVNAAERRADWWLFGGIYRPVFFKAVPKIHIERIAVDASADGDLSIELHTKGHINGYSLLTSISPLGKNLFKEQKYMSLTLDSVQTVKTKWNNISRWDCEHPNLYLLRLQLLNNQNHVVHEYTERIGFRTVEFREKDGIYINGTKVLLKGVNRHCFYPEGGRTVNHGINMKDALLIKGMNMNAIRSHYPPDRDFLDICDSLGIFYLEELPGWHGKYDYKVGSRLLREMIIRDVNHPCIILWSNGNEGGWNTQLDSSFAYYDPQKRHVVHPWADFNGIDTHHYPSYSTGTGRLSNGYKVFMPTEFLHGQYDKGAGSALDDYWNKYTGNPLFAGGFLWAFADEAVVRTDEGGILDSDGSNGPDGIVGPHREKEGSYFTIREIWSPIQFSPLLITSSFNGEFKVSNKYLYSNLNECRMKYKIYSILSPMKEEKKQKILLSEGNVILPSVNPGETGTARMTLPANFRKGDILELEAYDKDEKSICNWTWPIKYANEYLTTQYQEQQILEDAIIEKSDSLIILSSKGIRVSFNINTGMISNITNLDKVIPLSNGPIAVGMKMVLDKISSYKDGHDAILTVKYKGAVDSIEWRMTSGGILKMNALLLNKKDGKGLAGEFVDNPVYYLGFSFLYPEKDITGMTWFGKGPYRVWKNRIKGTNYGLWQKKYNNTITGESYDHLIYPEFKGYHANLYWARIEYSESAFVIYSATDGIYFRLFTPQEPKHRCDGNTMVKFPAGDLSFLYEIPAMRSFKPITDLGPNSQPSIVRINSGDDGLNMNIWFDFR